MLEVARPETRARARPHATRFTWGVVDVILGVLMLPFGIWMFLIEKVVAGIAAVADR
ncbi:MAG TPA: hypothetical protein VGQ62_05625 [Chloroflexota bacterium]|nr:hypothetical protein [Chloroflexota bacterium]